MYAFDIAGTSAGPGSADFKAGSTGYYAGNGMGVCETGAGLPNNDCASPNHQINNGTDVNLTSGGQSGSTYYYEFILMQFVGASVNLQSMTLGNFGTNGSTTNPFGATYWTYTGSDTLTQMEAALGGTTAGNLGNISGFSGATSTTCTSGCSVNATGVTDALTGSNVTYLLFGASISSGAGSDFFKLQDLNIAGVTTTNSVSPTPEPATFGLVGLALAGLGIYGRKRK
jgi:hypothetical protein